MIVSSSASARTSPEVRSWLASISPSIGVVALVRGEELIEDVGHYVPLEAPDALAAIIAKAIAATT